MSIVSLALAKQHMKIVLSDEDELIGVYIDAAETWLSQYIGKPLAEFDPVPADLKLAILKLVAFHFEQREAAGFDAMQVAPYGVTAIADTYRQNWFGGDDGEA